MGLSIPGVRTWVQPVLVARVQAVRGFFAFHGVWAIGVRLLRRLSVRDKILAVMALVALPLLPMAAQLAVEQSRIVESAKGRMAGAQLLLETQLLADVMRAKAHELDNGKSIDANKLGLYVQRLKQVRDTSGADSQELRSAWEGLDPALARLLPSTSASPAARLEALRVVDLALIRLRLSVLHATGMLLTNTDRELAMTTLSYVQLPGLADEVAAASRAIVAYLAVQDRSQAELPRLTPELLALVGSIQSVDSALQRYQRFAESAVLDERDRPQAEIAQQVASFVSQLRLALQGDAQLSASELAAIRGHQDAVMRDLGAFRDQQLKRRVMEYGQDAAKAQTQRSLLVGGTLLSLSLSFYLFYCFYLVMRGGLHAVVDNLKRMATGDLRARRPPLGGDEVAATLRAMGQSVQHLSELLVHVRHGATSVSHAAQQISTGNSDLRSRNHRTSDALQRVVDGVSSYSAQLEACAAQVEVVVSTVEKLRLRSTRNRRQMDELRETLSRVRTSSAQIGEAVSLIDNVAFRTNILALNASIEASKAGESGKGFAVVAQEVRALAKRSAEAAGRINSIVSCSTTQVEQCGKLADDTGHAIAESDVHIDKIHSAMGDVAALTRDGQRESGVILDQVRDLRETTEKNLGLVEQLASASYSLRSHGERLTHRLSHFKLS